MIIEVQRDIFTKRSTTSQAIIEGVAPFFMLELPREDERGRRNVIGKTCIPPGTYPLVLRWSPHNVLWVPELVGVSGRSQIEIHPANEPKQLLGCLAPGLSRGEDRVDQSRAVFFPLMKILLDAVAKNEPAEIHIREAA